MGFKIGDKVVCIEDASGWDIEDAALSSPEPKKGEVYIINYVDSDHGGHYMVGLKEMPQDDCYEYTAFRKVEPPRKQTNKLSAKLVEELKESEIIKEVDTIDKPNPVHA